MVAISERSQQWRERQAAAQRKVQREAAKRRWADPEYRAKQQAAHRSPLGDRGRLWSNITVRGPDECWPWKGAKQKTGHGILKVGGKTLYPHRLVFEECKGPIPPGKNVLHSCDFGLCCNPAHLHAGTRAQNAREAWDRKRITRERGERNHQSRTTEADVREMRRLYRAGAYQWELAERFGLSQPAVSAIVTRRTWGHVED